MKLIFIFILAFEVLFLNAQEKNNFIIKPSKFDSITRRTVIGFLPDSIKSNLHLKNGLSFSSYFISTFSINPLQDYWYRYKSGEISKDEFLAYYKSRSRTYPGVDTIYYPIEKLNHELRIATVLDSSKLFLIVDKNNNNDLTDDQPTFICDMNSKFLKDTILNIEVENIEVFNKYGKSINQSFPFSIRLNFPKKEQDTVSLKKIQQKFPWIEFVNITYKSSHLSIKNKKYKILFETTPLINSFDRFTSALYIFNESDTINNKTQFNKIFQGLEFKNGDSIMIDNLFFKYSDNYASEGTLSLSEISGDNIKGYNPGFYLKRFTGTQIFNSKTFSSTDLTGKYIFIDFWGTWCEPCIKLFPSLKNIVQKLKTKYGNQFEFVSILYDKKENIEKAKSLIKDLDIEGTYVLDPRGESVKNSIIKILSVECYPTSIVVDPKGKIVIRGCGEEVLKEIKNKFKLE